MPDCVIEPLLSDSHDCLGHLSARKTLKRLQHKYFWIGMGKDVNSYCKKCHNCQVSKYTNHRTKPYLQPLPVVGPMERIIVDTISFPASVTKAGNRHILVFIDSFTKYVQMVATADNTAETVARVLIDNIIVRHGAPKVLLSDNGPNFASELCNAICHQMNVEKKFSTPYAPQTQGLVERFNRTLANMIRSYCTDLLYWDKTLPLLQFAYNSSVQESTRFSPFYLLYGRDPVLPMDHTYQLPIPVHRDVVSYIDSLKRKLHDVWAVTANNLAIAQKCQQRHYDKGHFDP